ncbi:TIGR01777 family oxidoreductase [Allomuricauda sp. SCSIO 65647]|uniref:TIGR01777 family oxidoreductase n=1 Tax=Allomuricauda sp. SCSIO 65647 TaxID=2908843 RepID=UPI001F36B2AE|nr:TIGR01777 family oxidoreductase [Muricauda sp. SCSIO 65647]UJH66777.1 TIGR01777 family oxidoreductase [Muricauda sp. SCSIO 65647]
MKVLVTGATGLIGTAIVDRLIKKGHVVHYLTTSKRKIESRDGYKGFYWNPSRSEIDANALQDVSVIINLAGSTISQRWTSKNKKKILNSRLQSLETLENALTKSKNDSVKMLITASAIGIYPNSETELYGEAVESVDESFLGEVTKKWEAKANNLEQLGLKVAKIRIGLVLSTDGGALPSLSRPIKYYVGAPLGSGEQWQSWIHIDDLARVFMYVMENELTGVYNGVAPNPVTNAKLTKEVANILGRPLWLPNVPKWALQLILGEMSYLLFASQRVSSKKIEKKGFSFEHPNLAEALRHLFDPSPSN